MAGAGVAPHQGGAERGRAVTARWIGAHHRPADVAAMVVAGLC